MVFNESTAKLVLFCTLGFGVCANFLGITSCDLLRYDVPSGGDGGSIGLFSYRSDGDGAGRCVTYTDETAAEDPTFAPARAGAIASLILALCLFALHAIHYTVRPIPQKDVAFYTIGAFMQLSLALVQFLWRNDLCDTYGCHMGEGSSWNGVAHIMYVAATCISLFIEEPQRSKTGAPLKQLDYSITSPFVRQASSRSILELR